MLLKFNSGDNAVASGSIYVYEILAVSFAGKSVVSALMGATCLRLAATNLPVLAGRQEVTGKRHA